MQKAIVDANILLEVGEKIFDKYTDIIIPLTVLEECDKLKVSDSESKSYKARNAVRLIEKYKDRIHIENKCGVFSLPTTLQNNRNSADNEILSIVKDLTIKNDNKYIFVSYDLNLIHKARSIGVPCQLWNEKENNELYTGYKEVTLDEYNMSLHYECPVNRYGLLNNEYLIIKDGNGDIVDKQKWTNDKGFSPLSYRQIDSMYMGKIKPRNTHQELAFDLFQNKNILIKVIFGKYGSGKDLIMSAHALSMIQKGTYDKLIFVRNNYGVKNSKDIGFLPGDINDKLLPYAMPLADHVGGVDGLKMLINQGKIELQHLGFIRGRDIKNSIVYCSEAENMTKEHIQLLIGRLAEGSTLWLNGDFKQIDDNIFERNNGLKQVINSLRDSHLFGCVELNVVERSEVAKLADLLD